MNREKIPGENIWKTIQKITCHIMRRGRKHIKKIIETNRMLNSNQYR